MPLEWVRVNYLKTSHGVGDFPRVKEGYSLGLILIRVGAGCGISDNFSRILGVRGPLGALNG